MRKNYSTPETLILTIESQSIMAGSGPGAGDQNNPGFSGSRRGRSRSKQWEDWEDEEEEADDEG